MDRKRYSPAVATAFASLGFVVLIIGITYFALLVLRIQFADDNQQRAASYYELAHYLSGEKQEWFQDARIYGAGSLLCALVSVLFGVHPLARITIPVAGAAYVLLQFFGEGIWQVITDWAKAIG